MKLKICFLYSLFCLLSITGFSSTVKSQIAKNQANERNAVKKLRELYVRRDFEDGAAMGEKLVKQFPANTELQAWYILNLANSGTGEESPSGVMTNPQTSRAIEAAKILQKKIPNDAWANLALGQAYNLGWEFNESAAPIDKALEIAPNNEEFIFARANYLGGLGKYDEMNAWLDKNSAKLNQPRLLNLKILALLRQSNQFPNKREKLTEFFTQSLKLEPNNVNTNYYYAFRLNEDKQFDKAIPVWKKAILLSPNNIQIHEAYWTAILGQTDKTDEQKNAALAKDVSDFLAASKNSPISLMIVSQKYDELSNYSKRDFYENQTLQKFPNTRFDEIVVFNRIRRTESAAKESAQKEDKFRETNEMSWNFVKRPTHFDDNKLGFLYFDLLNRLGSSRKMTDTQLTELIEGSLKYNKNVFDNVNSTIAKILIDGKKIRPNSKLSGDAKKYARAGISEAEDRAKNLPLSANASLRGQAFNTLGYVLTEEGKFDEAEQILIQAKQLNDTKSNNFSMVETGKATNNYLAQLYTAKKEYDKAEEYYLNDALDDDSARKNFTELYEQRTGNKTGFDSYYTEIRQKIKAKSRERVIASRIQNPKGAAPFLLKTIDDKEISLTDLKGKITVINIWGTWCAPCVGEMPQLQQLYKKYETDKDVAIITMDVRDELDAVKKFIADKKYAFPVLLGDSYTRNIMFDGEIAFPTTLFIDKQGKVSFVKVGETKNLLDEFGWRIEELKK